MSNNDKIIPVEIRMLKFPPKTDNGTNETNDKDSSNNNSKTDNETNDKDSSNKNRYITKYLTHIMKRYNEDSDKNKKPKIFLFKCFGWFDYLLLIFSPHIRCMENYDSDYKNVGSVMTTSFVLWISSEYNNILYTKINSKYNIYHPPIKNVENLLGCIRLAEFLNNDSILSNNYKNIIGDNNNDNNGCKIYCTLKTNNKDLIYIISFIKLNENNNGYVNNIKKIKNELDSKLKNNKNIIDYIIFDYLGIWDIAIMVSLKCENIKNYKNNFLVPCKEIQQSSSIVLIPIGAKDNILSNR